MMRLHLFFLVLLELNVLVCTSFKTEVFRRFLSRGSKEPRTISMVHQRSTCSLAPGTGNDIDYAKNSRRASAFFVNYDEGSCQSYINVTLISKSDFKTWSSAISDATHEFQTSIGQSVRKFPGNKVVTFVGDNISVVSMLAFYDDSELKTKNTHKIFDGLWGSLKNKTYHFRGINETGVQECNLIACTLLKPFTSLIIKRTWSVQITCRHILKVLFCCICKPPQTHFNSANSDNFSVVSNQPISL
jgi:hypothetical protein